MSGEAQPGGAGNSEVPEGWSEAQEGKAKLLQRGNDVFYNPAMAVNRDMSIAVLREFIKMRDEEIRSGALKRWKRKPLHKAQPGAGAGAEGGSAAAKDVANDAEELPLQFKAPGEPNTDVRIFEGLAATGLRSLRYALEVQDGVEEIVANDMDPGAVEAIRQNVARNGAQAAARITPSVGSASVVMLSNPQQFDVVDLDPYGSPVQFLDSAVQTVTDGGLLMVTATDTAVLCGNNGETCFAKYGAYPLHRYYCHEQAVRVLLSCMEAHANRYKRRIVPLLSLYMDYYVRVFVRVYTSAKDVKDTPSDRLAYVYQSQNCDTFHLQPVGTRTVKGSSVKYSAGRGPAVPQKCDVCGSGFLFGGPIWAAPLHDKDFVTRLGKGVRAAGSSGLHLYDYVEARLTNVEEELIDVPLYIDLHHICGTLKVTPIKMDTFRSALGNAGYRVSGSHANPLAVKTDAPWGVIWDVLRQWTKEAAPDKQYDPDGVPAAILSKPIETAVSFARHVPSLSKAKMNNVGRFLPNPDENWGPQRKHGKAKIGESAKDIERAAQAKTGKRGAGADGGGGKKQKQ
ncbi:unnamed protein product [Pedinophyceae sp. YPF-701]|nr:unnamed protein product [Pedinophyceae sp. YPF-701]